MEIKEDKLERQACFKSNYVHIWGDTTQEPSSSTTQWVEEVPELLVCGEAGISVVVIQRPTLNF